MQIPSDNSTRVSKNERIKGQELGHYAFRDNGDVAMNNVFSEFSALIRQRLSTRINTTEDSIRYTFFVALLYRANIQPHEIILEYPHPVIKGEIDTYIPSLNGKPMVIEFKYDRDIPSGGDLPKPQNAGELFADIYRLYRFTMPTNPDRLMVYCTDQVMAQYFRNPKNGYSGFFDLVQGQTMPIGDSFINSKANTFRKYIGGSMSVTLGCLWSEDLPREHYLRIYRVVPS